ncbi:unnamed protein product [Symbiodinium pilosum]|uniref:Uncharacterized protein n=1 Tax=Symbiodinium pilosum TaxID=2952 RepID=A0A812QAA9_SYMPI|nr:unnamed protein product [Symbiodinium pilosum]
MAGADAEAASGLIACEELMPEQLELQTDEPARVQGVARKLTVTLVTTAVVVALMWMCVLQIEQDSTSAISPMPKSSIEVANDMGVQPLLELFELSDMSPESHSHANSSLVAEIFKLQRHLQDMTQNPLALPIATCTVDVYLVASFIGIIGNVVNGAVKACKRKDKYRSFVTLDRFKEDLLRIDFLDERKKAAIMKLLDQGCRIGVESSVALFSFTAAFLARAAADCALSMKLPPNPNAQCAADMALLVSGVSYLAAGAETADATCPPYPGLRDPQVVTDLVDVSAIDIVGGLSRRLGIENNPVGEAKLDDVRQIVLSRLPTLASLGGFVLSNKEWIKIRREKRKAKSRKEKEIKCGFDIAGLLGFAAAAGVFITAGTVECPLAAGDASAEPFKMGCSLDISAVIAAFTTIGGFVGILATECPADPKNAAANLCATGSLNIVSSLGFLSGALSDVKRSCGAQPAS